ncbi:TPA: ead/Ea22-like family protein [Escherichia coli]|uniref:ead/Ea22-like family protein n=1 Tax=Escherichia coli TaxID=562 RepID=UPI001875FB50|nr:ead/Ea22-like family protein [Escherichia coli]MBE5003555.1 ead/Ea22-like family protein [Escherichia coli]HAM5443429.1 ead/Ea22-like family protein [Escherichia coli]HBC8530414.1 ead/Ea22-like family protein [Escherichia coli]HBL6816796.1 ead/Ea22-like family protein [Escherichia coli]HBL6864290.1 ead/Ea22-like family protein [Escherichia coli]
MSEINYQALREAAERAIPAMERLLMLPADDDLLSEQELKDNGVDIDALNAFKFLAGPETVLALLDERERNQQYIKSRDQENEEIALTVGKLRVELEGKDKLIAELGKQCAEWERKALSNFEECAAMAERIEELEQANSRQDANINHQQEGMTQSVTRYIYHYNAVNGSDSMSGIAQLTFMIKSQSDLEELKSALSKVCGFHANAITSLSYLGCEEEANTKDANPNGGA